MCENKEIREEANVTLEKYHKTLSGLMFEVMQLIALNSPSHGLSNATLQSSNLI